MANGLVTPLLSHRSAIQLSWWHQARLTTSSSLQRSTPTMAVSLKSLSWVALIRTSPTKSLNKLLRQSLAQTKADGLKITMASGWKALSTSHPLVTIMSLLSSDRRARSSTKAWALVVNTQQAGTTTTTQESNRIPTFLNNSIGTYLRVKDNQMMPFKGKSSALMSLSVETVPVKVLAEKESVNVKFECHQNRYHPDKLSKRVMWSLVVPVLFLLTKKTQKKSSIMSSIEMLRNMVMGLDEITIRFNCSSN